MEIAPPAPAELILPDLEQWVTLLELNEPRALFFIPGYAVSQTDMGVGRALDRSNQETGYGITLQGIWVHQLGN